MAARFVQRGAAAVLLAVLASCYHVHGNTASNHQDGVSRNLAQLTDRMAALEAATTAVSK